MPLKFGNEYVFPLTLYKGCNHLSMLGTKSIHFIKRSPRGHHPSLFYLGNSRACCRYSIWPRPADIISNCRLVSGQGRSDCILGIQKCWSIKMDCQSDIDQGYNIRNMLHAGIISYILMQTAGRTTVIGIAKWYINGHERVQSLHFVAYAAINGFNNNCKNDEHVITYIRMERHLVAIYSSQ